MASGANLFSGISRNEICATKNLWQFLSEHNIYGALISVSLALMLSSLVTTITTNAVSPIVSKLCGTNLMNAYVILEDGAAAPYSTMNPATDDPTAIIIHYGLIITALISFFLVILFYYLVTRFTCINYDAKAELTRTKKTSN